MHVSVIAQSASCSAAASRSAKLTGIVPRHCRRPQLVRVRASDGGLQEPATQQQQHLQEPSRHMALPSNALWLLDFLQDKFYDVRGDTFVIQRAESEDMGSTVKRSSAARRKRSGPPAAPQHGSAPGEGSRALRLINRVVHQQPGSIMLMLEGGVVDVSEFMDPFEPQGGESGVHGDQAGSIAPNTVCTGIVRVEQPQAEDEALEVLGVPEGLDVFFNSSSSPRRTKMVAFTCKCCGARTHSPVNPRAFHEGTLVAQCAKCQRWHKLSDHLGLFHDLQGPVLRGRPLVDVDDIPPALRLRDLE